MWSEGLLLLLVLLPLLLLLLMPLPLRFRLLILQPCRLVLWFILVRISSETDDNCSHVITMDNCSHHRKGQVQFQFCLSNDFQNDHKNGFDSSGFGNRSRGYCHLTALNDLYDQNHRCH